jgi:DUF1680 family protein
MTGITDHDANPVRRTRLPAIHTTTCCLPNAWRFFGQLPEYIFSVRDDGIVVNLYTAATARHRLADGTNLTVAMETTYPRDGTVTMTLDLDRPATFSLHLRIPAWCPDATISVAGQKPTPARPGSYSAIRRDWIPGDTVRLVFPMRPVAVFSRPEITANRDQVVFRRGPVVYCLEKQDAAGLDLATVMVVLDANDPSRSARSEFNRTLGFHVLKVVAGDRHTAAPIREVTLVPFWFRANREEDTRWITFLPYRP